MVASRDPADGFWGRIIWSRSGFGSFARQILPSSLQGGFGDLAVLERFGLKNQPEKKFWNVFGVNVGGYLFPDDSDAFWAR